MMRYGKTDILMHDKDKKRVYHHKKKIVRNRNGIWTGFLREGNTGVKPQLFKAVYSIEISRDIYEEIRVNEKWDDGGKPLHSERYEEGYIWSELYGQSQVDPFEKWAFNFHMSVLDGNGTPESLFENHFAKEMIRRRGLNFIYPDQDSDLSQEEYWKQDPCISWLYYKRSFDAVFPVLCEMGKTHLAMEIEGVLDNGRACRFVYSTGKDGELWVDGKRLLNIRFFDERYKGRRKPELIGEGESGDERTIITIYGLYSLQELFDAIEVAAR